jgi:hypothetical protein
LQSRAPWEGNRMSSETVIVDIGPLTEAEVVAVARHGAGVELSAAARTAIAATRPRRAFIRAERRAWAPEPPGRPRSTAAP